MILQGKKEAEWCSTSDYGSVPDRRGERWGETAAAERLAALFTHSTKPRHGHSIDLNDLLEHGSRTHPEATLSILRSVDNQFFQIIILSAMIKSGDSITHPLEVKMPSLAKSSHWVSVFQKGSQSQPGLIVIL